MRHQQRENQIQVPQKTGTHHRTLNFDTDSEQSVDNRPESPHQQLWAELSVYEHPDIVVSTTEPLAEFNKVYSSQENLSAYV